MALSNSRYERIMRHYDELQSANRAKTLRRKQEINEKLPEIKALKDQCASLMRKQSEAVLFGTEDEGKKAVEEYRSFTRKAKEKRVLLLKEAGYPEDYLEPVYSCKDCKDTGRLSDGSYCHCFRQLAIAMMYEDFDMPAQDRSRRFLDFDLSCYSKDTFRQGSEISSFESAKNALAKSQSFVENFKNQHGNILIYGGTGTGKTFLSDCIANELIQRGHTVLYLTAPRLFSVFSQEVFQHTGEEAYSNIFDAELLVIDDLGTESSNRMVEAWMFQIINERHLRGGSTVISTNLSLQGISELYTERVYSRIMENYELLPLFGRDIRIEKRISG